MSGFNVIAVDRWSMKWWIPSWLPGHHKVIPILCVKRTSRIGKFLKGKTKKQCNLFVQNSKMLFTSCFLRYFFSYLVHHLRRMTPLYRIQCVWIRLAYSWKPIQTIPLTPLLWWLCPRDCTVIRVAAAIPWFDVM